MSAAVDVRVCKICSTPIVGRPTTSLYCGIPCRDKQKAKRRKPRPGSHKRHDRTCQHCGQAFKGEHDARYCSPSCRGTAGAHTLFDVRSCVACRVEHRSGECPACRAKALREREAQRRAAREVSAAERQADIEARTLHLACLECGAAFTTTMPHQVHCRKRCTRRARKRDHDAKRRLWIAADRDARISRHEIMERDNWTCQLCHETIDRDETPGTPWAASLDHIIPLAQGGSHRMVNLQAAHQLCNSLKGATLPQAAQRG